MPSWMNQSKRLQGVRARSDSASRLIRLAAQVESLERRALMCDCGAVGSHMVAADLLNRGASRLLPATSGVFSLRGSSYGPQVASSPTAVPTAASLALTGKAKLPKLSVATANTPILLAPNTVVSKPKYDVKADPSESLAPVSGQDAGEPVKSGPITPETRVSVGTNVNISRSTVYEAETTIAIDPTNPNRMFSASNLSSTGMRAAYSLDAGATWTTRTMASGSDGLPAACCDPQSTFDKFGNLYLVYLNSAVTQVVIALSTDAGQTFTTLTTIAGSSIDQPSIAAGGDNLSAANASVWITYNLGGVPQLTGARVTGFGAANIGAFAAVRATGGSGNFGDVAVGPNGEVVVSWQNPSGGQGPVNVQMVRDPDGQGAAGLTAVSTITSTNVGGFDYIPAQSNRSVDAEANFAYDLSNGPRRGRLYMSYTEEVGNESNDTDIMTRYSDDHGTTWSSPVRVNDDPAVPASGGGVRSQFFPEIAVDPTSGNVGVAFYDARNDNGVVGGGFTDTTINNEVQLWATYSTDGGLSYQPNFQVSAGASKASTIGNPNDFGDYGDMDYYGGALYPVWADNSTALGNNPSTTQPDMATARVITTVPAGPRAASSTPSGATFTATASIDFTFDSSMNPASFSIAADVQSFTGPGAVDLKPQITSFSWLNANTTLRVNFTSQSALGSYSMVIGPQILSASTGNAMDQNGNGVAGEAVLDRYTASFAVSAPIVLSHTPTISVDGPVSSIDYTFNTTMDPASFSFATDIASFTGPAGNLLSQITGTSWLNSNTTLRVSFNAQTARGAYAMTIGPNISALGGLGMNQDGDATAVEAVADQYTATLNIDPTVGPDTFGYRAIAQSVASGINLVPGGSGVVTIVDNADDGTASIPLGTSTFRFYGTVYTGTSQLFVSSNGLITFASANSAYENTDLTASPTEAAIAPLWDDWQTDNNVNDSVLYRFDDLNADTIPDQLVIEWNEVPHYRPTGPTGPGSFQAILQLNTGTAQGNILFSYGDVNFDSARATNGASATAGVKAAGTQGGNRLFITQNSDASLYVVDQRSILITTADIAIPAVTADGFDHTQNPHKITVTFSENVQPSLSVADLQVQRIDVLGAPFNPVSFSYVAGTNTATFNFASVLPNGSYRATLSAAGVTDGVGNALSINRTIDFFVLAGDANRDRIVNIDDLSILAQNYGLSGKNWQTGDFNFDGLVNIDDLSTLAQNYGIAIS